MKKISPLHFIFIAFAASYAAASECFDSPSFYLFKPDRTCEWASKRSERRCSKRSDKDNEMQANCPIACGQCSANPTNSPTGNPLSTPTGSPSKASTPTTEYACADSENFYLRKNTYRNCDWASKHPDVRCNKRIDPNLEMREHCPAACGICPTVSPTAFPTTVPTAVPSALPTAVPTSTPTSVPTTVPTTLPTAVPSAVPTTVPTTTPTALPTAVPTTLPTAVPSALPTTVPTSVPTTVPTAVPSALPTTVPTAVPTAPPTAVPTTLPTTLPTAVPSTLPTAVPSTLPTAVPTSVPMPVPTSVPTTVPTTPYPSSHPTPSATCVDDSSWYKDDSTAKDCVWVGKKKNKRCSKRSNSANGMIPASSVCKASCNTCFTPTTFPTIMPTPCGDSDSTTWHKWRNTNKDCEWVAKRPNKRCFVGSMKLDNGAYGDFAKEECRAACCDY